MTFDSQGQLTAWDPPGLVSSVGALSVSESGEISGTIQTQHINQEGYLETDVMEWTGAFDGSDRIEATIQAQYSNPADSGDYTVNLTLVR